jgi:hypothetical protein
MLILQPKLNTLNYHTQCNNILGCNDSFAFVRWMFLISNATTFMIEVAWSQVRPLLVCILWQSPMLCDVNELVLPQKEHLNFLVHQKP